MEKRNTIICMIFIFAIVICASIFIIFSGITANDYNYVLLEINPKVEFLCDKNYKVVSCNPLNEEGDIILSDLDYKGLDIDVATVDFLDQCARCGYLDVNGVDNAINITVIDGLTQALDVHITQEIYNYLRKKEILCAVIENYEDRNMYDQKKKHKLCCPNKYKLITTLLERNDIYKMDLLKNLSETELISIVTNEHTTYPFVPNEDLQKYKDSLILLNEEKYNNHTQAVSNATQKEFSQIFEEYQKTSAKKYSNNYEKEYTLWHNNLVS